MANFEDSLQKVNLNSKPISDYIDIVGADKINRLIELSKPLKSKRVLHFNTTAFGGGVAELLKSQVPLLKDLGLDVDWCIMRADPDFFEVTKLLHNALQGNPQSLKEEEKEVYLNVVKKNAAKKQIQTNGK